MVEGAWVLFLSLAGIVLTTYQTIEYLCAEKPEDSLRKIEFSPSANQLKCQSAYESF